MNKKNILVILSNVILLCMLSGTASAVIMYEATVAVYYPDDYEDLDNATWLLFGSRTIGISETENIMDLKIKLIDVEPETNSALLSIIYDGDVWQSVYIEDTEKFIGDDKDVKIKLTKLSEEGISSGIISDDDSVISIWIEPNSADVLGLSEGDKPNIFNPVEYGKTAGWSGASNVDEVILKIAREKDAYGILIEIDGGEWEEIDSSNNDIRNYELTENGEYTITITYTSIDFWGGEKEEVEKYILQVSGLNTASSSSSSTISNTGLLGAFGAVAESKTTIVTSSEGTFTAFDGMTATSKGQNADGNYVWDVTFSSPGSKKITYKTTGGQEGYFDFTISAKQVVDPVVSKTDNDTSKTSTWLLIVGIIGLLAVVLLISKKKNKHKRGAPDDKIPGGII